MRAHLKVGACAVALLVTTPASAHLMWPIHGYVTLSAGVNCPFASTTPDDNCTSTPTDLNFKAPSLFTGTSTGYVNTSNMLTAAQNYPSSLIGAGIGRESGQAPSGYAKTSNYDVAGVTFGVGYSPSQVAQAGGWKDPATINTDRNANPDGNGVDCQFNASGSAYASSVQGAQIFCSGSSLSGLTIDIEDYDMTMYGCTSLIFDAPNMGTADTVKIKNLKFLVGPGCVTSMFGKGDSHGNNVNSHSPGGGYITAYIGDIFQGYILSGSTTLCVVGTPSQGTVEVQNNPAYFIVDTGESMGNPSYPPVNYYITAAGGAGCQGGEAAYTLNQAPNNSGSNFAVGSHASPVTFQEANFNLTVTAINTAQGGVMNTSQVLQSDNNVPLVDIYGSIKILTCPGGICSNQTGVYTIQGYGPLSQGLAAPPQGWVVGNALGGLISVTANSGCFAVDIEQVYIDGDDIEYPSGSTAGAMALGLGCGNLTLKNIGVVRLGSRVFNTAASVVDMENIYIEDFGVHRIAGHLETAATAPPQGATLQLTVKNYTVVGPADMTGDFGTADMWNEGYHGNNTVWNNVKYVTLINNSNQWNGDNIVDRAIDLGNSNTYVGPTGSGAPVFDHIFIDGTGIRLCTLDDGASPAAQNSWLTSVYNMVSGNPVTAWSTACP